MNEKLTLDRRNFLKQAAGAVGAVTQADHWPSLAAAETPAPAAGPNPARADVNYPRRFKGRQLQMISFPLGGVGAGSLGLGGRGQLVNWEIFNRPN